MKNYLTFLCIISSCFLTNHSFSQTYIFVNSEEKTEANGVEIDGVVWAVSNVGEKGELVSNPEENGKYYTWEEAKTVCPAGWRLPTREELLKLNKNKLERSEVNGIKGRYFGEKENRIFIPCAGYIVNEKLCYSNKLAVFWSSSIPEMGSLFRSASELAFTFVIYFSMNQVLIDTWLRYWALSVRCVAE